MVFQCVFTSFKDYYVNTSYNFDLFGYKSIIVLHINLKKKLKPFRNGFSIVQRPNSKKAGNLGFLGFFL